MCFITSAITGWINENPFTRENLEISWSCFCSLGSNSSGLLRIEICRWSLADDDYGSGDRDMKILIGWPLSWGLYLIGHIFYFLLMRHLYNELLSWLYRPYNWLMVASLNVQLWGGNYGPWYKDPLMDDGWRLSKYPPQEYLFLYSVGLVTKAHMEGGGQGSHTTLAKLLLSFVSNTPDRELSVFVKSNGPLKNLSRDSLKTR